MNEQLTLYGYVLRHVTLVIFSSAAFSHFCQHDMVQIVAEKCLKFSYLLLEKSKHLWKGMMLQSCYAVFATSILSSFSFNGFLTHVVLEKEPFAAWKHVSWSWKGRSKTTTFYMDGLSNQEKNYAKKLYQLYTYLYL